MLQQRQRQLLSVMSALASLTRTPYQTQGGNPLPTLREQFTIFQQTTSFLELKVPKMQMGPASAGDHLSDGVNRSCELLQTAVSKFLHKFSESGSNAAPKQ